MKCFTCDGTGLVYSSVNGPNPPISNRCPDCGGFGVLKYKIKPVRSKKTGSINAWLVVTPEQDFLKVEFSFDDAVVWMDIHASANYGRLEMC